MEHNMLGVAIFCGLYYAFAGWRPLYLTHSIWLFPLTSALPIGLLMGDVKGAMILGAAISMLYVGLIAPRGIFCAIGRCTDCVMIVDGQPNVRTCVTPLHAGMKVQTQYGVSAKE